VRSPTSAGASCCALLGRDRGALLVNVPTEVSARTARCTDVAGAPGASACFFERLIEIPGRDLFRTRVTYRRRTGPSSFLTSGVEASKVPRSHRVVLSPHCRWSLRLGVVARAGGSSQGRVLGLGPSYAYSALLLGTAVHRAEPHYYHNFPPGGVSFRFGVAARSSRRQRLRRLLRSASARWWCVVSLSLAFHLRWVSLRVRSAVELAGSLLTPVGDTEQMFVLVAVRGFLRVTSTLNQNDRDASRGGAITPVDRCATGQSNLLRAHVPSHRPTPPDGVGPVRPLSAEDTSRARSSPRR